MYELKTNYSVMRDNIVKLSMNYLTQNKMDCVVLGVSGGIDSALVAALIAETGFPIHGVRLPLSGNKIAEVARAVEVCNMFCMNSHTVNLSVAVQLLSDYCFRNGMPDTEAIRSGNIKARMRMIYLFDLARAKNGLVLSTDNLTEYLLGFWTLHGDVGNFGPIQQLWKTEVYGLAEFLVEEYRNKSQYRVATALQACIDAIPTDGLGITDSDFDQILPGQDESKTAKERYQEVDEILIKYYREDLDSLGKREELRKNPVIIRHLNSEFKRRDPVSLSRKAITE